MKLLRAAVVILTLALVTLSATAQKAATGHDYPVQPVPFTAVHLTDVFWAPRIETNRKVTIPAAFQKCEESGRMNNFERAAMALRGEPHDKKAPPYPFDDSDLYKVIEGAAYVLSAQPDPRLDAYVDGLIAKIAAAQEPDGYIYTTRTIDPEKPHPWAGKARWVNERNDSHELYNMGHLFEAAAAHYQATGKKTLLTVATRAADLLVATFGPDKRSIWPGHQITEMGLVKLYRVTGKEQYLSLAKFLIDVRGPDGIPAGETVNGRGLAYNQAQLRVIDQTEPVGHAVRAMYMYSGMADVAALEDDSKIKAAGDRIWENLVHSKLYLTGGIGAAGGHEGFGDPYDLPNMTAYNETCASVGMDYWNHRQFLLHGDAKYIDIMERTLYNGLISGVSLKGDTFFYPNPLESNGQHARAEWFGVACCPGNITRFMASVPGYIYAKRDDPSTLFVNLFAAGTADLDLAGGKLRVSQATTYPWEGDVRITLEPDQARAFTVDVRIPGWAREEPVPGDLYRFADTASAKPTLRVNGKPIPVTLTDGYVPIARTWARGDTIDLTLPMPVRRIVAHEKVEADRDRVALQRGPIVYAAEWPDNPRGKVRNIVLPDTNAMTAEFRADLLNGVSVVKGRAVGLSYDERGALQRAEQPFVAIPYATWANRGRGQMEVWIARTESSAKPTPYPTVATTATLTHSPSRKNIRNIVDGEDPRSSNDPSSYFDWWPTNGCTPAAARESAAPASGQAPATRRCSEGEWIEMAFAKPSTVSETQVYWFDDTGRGGVRVPKSWHLLYKDPSTAEWKAVEQAGDFGVAKDAYNTVRFRPVMASGLRIELVMQPNVSAGVQEWKVK